jgi:glutamine synthetase
MHVHQSLAKGNRNAFFAAGDQYHLSPLAKKFIAGIMTHADEIIAITNQWVNSYKRLVPGYEAPVYNSWARRNRSTMLRVPMYQTGQEGATRVEFRAPDPACNPYLAFAVMLAAGMEGVNNNYELAPPIEENIFQMTAEEKAARGIKELPGNLFSAIQAVKKSALVKSVLGDHMFEKFIQNKEIEWDLYRIHVSRYELDKYLPFL